MVWHVAHIGPETGAAPSSQLKALRGAGLTAYAYEANDALDRKSSGIAHYRQAAIFGDTGCPLPFGMFGGTLDQASAQLESSGSELAEIHHTFSGSAEISLSLTSLEEHDECATGFLKARKQHQQRADARLSCLRALAKDLAADLSNAGLRLRDEHLRADGRCERTSHLDLTCAATDAQALLAALSDTDFDPIYQARISGPFVPFGAVARAWTSLNMEAATC